ncbi:MAG: PEP-CTERM sorting domain-containing protein [Aquabacterium sp.]|jgi:hypothetical protein|uniref:PEP-CTERM sorting domain-containing protein n=1 Tax=Aquabacterium sp. TaxID=1872578 RepID=UPI003BB04954
MRTIIAAALLAASFAASAQNGSLGYSGSLIDAIQPAGGNGSGTGSASASPSYTIVSTSIDMKTKTLMATLSDGRILPLDSLKNLAPVSSVPEPGTMGLMALGIAALAWHARRKR